jgi:hypothetical protein
MNDEHRNIISSKYFFIAGQLPLKGKNKFEREKKEINQ